MQAVLKAQINKTDRNDARGIAQMMRLGLYRPVHVKTLRNEKLRMLLTHRKLLQSKAIAIENDLRGTSTRQCRWLAACFKPVIVQYQGKVLRIYFRADAAFAMPGVYECLEAERVKYAIRIPTNQVLQNRIGYLLKRPVGLPPNEVQRYYANFTYQAASWTKPRRVIAKVEWHPGELVPRVGFIVTNMSRPAERVVAFYNKRGTCEQWIKEGKGVIKWTRLSCRSFTANAVRLQRNNPVVKDLAEYGCRTQMHAGATSCASARQRKPHQRYRL